MEMVFLMITAQILFCSIHSAAQPDLEILLKVKRDWGNPAALSAWDNFTANPMMTYCDWPGLTCENGRVTKLALPHSKIRNPIPPSLCELNLTVLDLSFNSISGRFPTLLFSCNWLAHLNLSNNELQGNLPHDISRLSSLEDLVLSNNKFTGTVPQSIGNIPNLKLLSLHMNQFNGDFPEVGRLTELVVISIGDNNFNPGPIPASFSLLKQLHTLSARNANYIGSIPQSLSALTELRILDLSDNNLHGKIPNWILNHKKLQMLELHSNNLDGDIGEEITAVKLKRLNLSNNNLSGNIPDMGNLSIIVSIDLDSNKFYGNIPQSIGLLPHLMAINLSTNLLSGSIPPEIGKYTFLQSIDVSNNMLTNDIPDTLCRKGNLQYLNVMNNNLSGGFPNDLSKCDTLVNIIASSNQLTGTFPESIWLDLPILTAIRIEDNQFTGQLPLGLSQTLREIRMGNNFFSGPVPVSAVGLRVFWAENNKFSHGLPADMTNLGSLSDLQLQRNSIMGAIPQSILSLKSLVRLNLSYNSLTGEVPQEIGLLPILSCLDISFNKLTGEVPASLLSLRFKKSFLGNSLCADNVLQLLPRCKRKKHGHKKEIVIGVSSGIAIMIGVAISGYFIIQAIRRKNAIVQDHSIWKMVPFGPLNFTALDIVNHISQDKLLGTGGSGKVYRVDTEAGSPVAVKVLENTRKREVEQEKQFLAEVSMLGNVRHANIVKIICYILSRDTKLVVYEFMENGTLEEAIHGQRMLDWVTRLRVSIDVAKALDYIHTNLTKPIVHCDIKTSNILLTSNFTAKIGDFGLAREIESPGEETVSKLRGTLGYMAPEYAVYGKVSEKQDVYSYGVVLLEMVTGRKSLDYSGGLADWARARHNRGVPFMDVVGMTASDPSGVETLVSLFDLAVRCVNYDASLRPKMREVLNSLSMIWEKKHGYNTSSSQFSILLE